MDKNGVQDGHTWNHLGAIAISHHDSSPPTTAVRGEQTRPAGSGLPTGDDAPRWRIAEAKQRLSELVRAAAEEPQMIYNRDRLTAAVVGGPTLAAFLDWQTRRRGRTLAGAFAELRDLAGEDGWTLQAPPRGDRSNAFAAGSGEEVSTPGSRR